MELKDWVVLLVPIFFNGIIVFVLQKYFEKRQLSKAIKNEYASHLRIIIDESLELHAKATQLANEGDNNNDLQINDLIKQFVNRTLDVYYYYVQNKIIFSLLDDSMEQIAKLVLDLTNCSHQQPVNSEKFSSLCNSIRDELMILKKSCIEFRF